MRTLRPLIFLFGVALTFPAFGRDGKDQLIVELKFTPQESVHSTSANVPANVLSQPIKITVDDARQLADKMIVGQGSNDDDEQFAIRAAGDPLTFFSASMRGIVAELGVKPDDGANRVLVVRLIRLFVDESNKAVGSMYAAEVKVTYRLAVGGKTLIEGATSGSARRYGRARSAPNCAEVLSDATKEAVTNMIADPALQEAWGTGKPPKAEKGGQAATGGSVEERLRKLDDLLKKGVITKPEYDAKRAEILKDL